MSALGLCLIPLVLLLSLVEAWLWKFMRRFLARMVKGNFQTNISLVFFFEILVSSRWEFSFFRLRLKDLGIFELEFKTPKKSLSAEDLKYFVRGRYGSLNLSRLTANTPDEAPLGMCARKVKVDDFDQVFWWNPFQIASISLQFQQKLHFIASNVNSPLEQPPPGEIHGFPQCRLRWHRRQNDNSGSCEGLFVSFPYVFLKNKVTLISDHRGPTWASSNHLSRCHSVDDCFGEEHGSSGFGCLWCLGQLDARFFRPSDLGFWQGLKIGRVFLDWLVLGASQVRGGPGRTVSHLMRFTIPIPWWFGNRFVRFFTLESWSLETERCSSSCFLAAFSEFSPRNSSLPL